ncbi:AEC family transporter [Priestia filamentosa]|uniref:Uncharacterized protein n=2 Tax=Priestia filamentosa TaxID=1402861 RepID=A0A1X7EM10_9BACI|nr:AEC family transporter [Priestia filamentosa]AKO93174.1 hypothetical protein BEH_14470 [Priestia filamentosa]MDT3763310.1 AEC family transporter [Priestia filamentosa]OXS69814.1 hypothetical protein B1B01_12740 [Priestia filamentosa]RJS63538.1 hypothetical protein CJ485_01860 [Priestia filamentosa]SMF36464.1 hypothetical protein SAMN06296056_1021128 [Priestia filamentosa]
MTFFTVVLPVFSIFLIGFIGEKKIGFDTRTISTMTLYLMSPLLVFRTFYTIEFNLDYLYLTVYTFALCFVLILIVYIIAFVQKYSRAETCGMILASSFMNNGNYGTPVALLLFGTAGFDFAIILMVIQQLVMCTVGVYYAAKGGEEGDGIKFAIRSVRRMPTVYGAIAGTLFQICHIPIGDALTKAVDLVADATIPTVMIILGMQLAKISLRSIQKSKVTLSILIKLCISPCVSYIFTLFLPLDEMMKQIIIIMAAMPTAANTTMYAVQFNTDPDFVSSATLISTLLSLVTLPLIFAIVL